MIRAKILRTTICISMLAVTFSMWAGCSSEPATTTIDRSKSKKPAVLENNDSGAVPGAQQSSAPVLD